LDKYNKFLISFDQNYLNKKCISLHSKNRRENIQLATTIETNG